MWSCPLVEFGTMLNIQSHPPSPNQFYLHIMFSKVEFKCNSELEVKKRVVWLVY